MTLEDPTRREWKLVRGEYDGDEPFKGGCAGEHHDGREREWFEADGSCDYVAEIKNLVNMKHPNIYPL